MFLRGTWQDWYRCVAEDADRYLEIWELHAWDYPFAEIAAAYRTTQTTVEQIVHEVGQFRSFWSDPPEDLACVTELVARDHDKFLRLYVHNKKLGLPESIQDPLMDSEILQVRDLFEQYGAEEFRDLATLTLTQKRQLLYGLGRYIQDPVRAEVYGARKEAIIAPTRRDLVERLRQVHATTANGKLRSQVTYYLGVIEKLGWPEARQ